MQVIIQQEIFPDVSTTMVAGSVPLEPDVVDDCGDQALWRGVRRTQGPRVDELDELFAVRLDSL